ncbi:hypothetical protein SLS53_004956 [Cytospora paraplurivora]|uniref:Cytochrome P450 n=1 Tax=Cytospora paraplurivora TaxID=2898453 RepID=A0AAN9UEP9_9PEZI
MHKVMWNLAQQKFSGRIFYLHLWPFSRTLLVVADAYAASQVEDLGLGKGDNIVKPISTITGGPSLLTMEGSEWKRWRRLFSTGFCAGYLIGLAPAIADEMAVFRDLLIKKCRNAPDGRSEVFPKEEMTVRVTFDFIGRVVLDSHLQYQLHANSLTSALRSPVEWTSWRGQLNPITSRTMDRYISHEIDKRFAERIEGTRQPSLPQGGGSEDLNKQFKSIASLLIDDVRSADLLLLSTFYASDRPGVVDLLLTEHNTTVGDHPGDALAQIHSDPHKLTNSPTPPPSLRKHFASFPLLDPYGSAAQEPFSLMSSGSRFPTENCSVWALSLAIHHDTRYWVEPEKFLPERWLIGPDDPLYAGRTKGAWQAFEHDPHNCIEQTLALLELKIALVLTAREINVMPAYENWDALHPKRGGGGKD